MRPKIAMALLLSFLLAALGQGEQALSESYPLCIHPYPCGDEWPDDLQGPFALKEVRYVRVPSHDGIELEGWIGLPDVPAGVRVPVALTSSPYLGGCNPLGATLQCRPTPGDPSFWSDSPPASAREHYWGVPPIELVRNGYAAAFFSVRGTGNSGGCLEFGGPAAQQDQAVLVDWLAAQQWSNGRVGMGGLSAMGTTPWEAAVRAPGALKTIVVSGIIIDWYTLQHTPQGATYPIVPFFDAQIRASYSLLPPLGGGPEHATAGRVPVIPERACPQTADHHVEQTRAFATDFRDATYWDSRRLIDRLDEVTSAVLLAHGFLDQEQHAFQESAVWATATNAPKRQVVGQWGHEFPLPERASLDPAWRNNTWSPLLIEWLDFWLKGIGEPPEHLGRVDYQDSAKTWRQSSSWPPAESRDEVVYLAGTSISALPGDGSRRYRSAPNILNSYRGATAVGSPFKPWAALCPDATSTAGTSGLVYVSEPAAQPVVIAGNPFAFIRVSSDLPGGIVTMKLADLAPDFSCDAARQPHGFRFLAAGAADLRFHAGTFTGRDFPVNTPTNVRIDLFDLAERIEAGHRLAVEVSYGETHIEWSGQPYYPEITVHSDGNAYASHVLLPIVEGTFGGAVPTITYPPRPFVPPASQT